MKRKRCIFLSAVLTLSFLSCMVLTASAENESSSGGSSDIAAETGKQSAAESELVIKISYSRSDEGSYDIPSGSSAESFEETSADMPPESSEISFQESSGYDSYGKKML